MKIVHKRITPFLVTLTLGLLAYRIVETNRPPSCYCPLVPGPPVKVLSVPDLDFPDAVKRAGWVDGTVKLQALFDSDGKVKNVRPYPMLPYGVPEHEAGHGQYESYTSARTDKGFVTELPFGLSQLAIDHITKTSFVPTSVLGEPRSELVSVLVSFGYHESRFSTGCNEIEITIMNSEGVVWRANIWTYRDRGCSMI